MRSMINESFLFLMKDKIIFINRCDVTMFFLNILFAVYRQRQSSFKRYVDIILCSDINSTGRTQYAWTTDRLPIANDAIRRIVGLTVRLTVVCSTAFCK